MASSPLYRARFSHSRRRKVRRRKGIRESKAACARAIDECVLERTLATRLVYIDTIGIVSSFA